MALTGKQTRQLRGMANSLKATIIIGKGGLVAGVLKQADDALEAHELVKFNVLDGCGVSANDMARAVAEEVGADIVQVIGHRFTLYRESSRDDIEKILFNL